MDVLGIDVEDSLVWRWVDWLAPVRQPFFLLPGEVADLRLSAKGTALDLPVHLFDTYEAWNLSDGLEAVWLSEQEFQALPRRTRAELIRAQVFHRRGAVPTIGDWADLLDPAVLTDQGDEHRFVWWSSLVEPHAHAIMLRVVSDGHLPCRRTEVPSAVWHAAASTLPEARTLSGTFVEKGQTNCFGTVVAASGVEGCADVMMGRDSFEAWLTARCVAGGRDDRVGTVLVWRTPEGICTHAAVTLGEGWALHKPGQEWVSPRQVLTVHDLIRLAPPGVALHRYSLEAAAR